MTPNEYAPEVIRKSNLPIDVDGIRVRLAPVPGGYRVTAQQMPISSRLSLPSAPVFVRTAD